MKVNGSKGQSLQPIVDEIKVHWELQLCENLLRLYQIFESDNNIYLVLEFQSEGSLLNHLEN